MENIIDSSCGIHTFAGGGRNSIIFKGNTELKNTVNITAINSIQVRSQDLNSKKGIIGKIIINTSESVTIATPVQGGIEIHVPNDSMAIKANISKIVVLADATIKVYDNFEIPQITKADSVIVDAKVVDENGQQIEEIDVEINENLEASDDGIIEGSRWRIKDFTYSGTTITGFSDMGEEKYRTNKNLILPPFNEEGEAITEIGDSAFLIADYNDKGNSEVGINSVKIPDTVEIIGKEAFRYNALTSINIPNSVTTIKMSAFNGNKLQSLVIPGSVTQLEGGAFTLNEIAELKLHNGLTVIPPAFAMNKLKYLEVPEGVTRIDDKAFSDNELVEVKLPSTLKYLSGFNNNEFRTITIPENIEELGAHAFASNKLTSVTIPGNVKVVGERAFNNTWHDQYLSSVIIEEGVEKIDRFAFANNQLKDVNLPDSLKELHENGFYKNLGYDGLVHLFTPEYKNINNLQESKHHVVNPAKLTIKYVFEDNILKEESIFKDPETEDYLHIGDKGIEIIPKYSDNQYELEDVNPRIIDLNHKENILTIQCKEKDIVEEVTIKSIGEVGSIAVDFGTSKDLVISSLPKKTFIIDSNNKEHVVVLGWILDNYNGEISGSYTAVGTFELPQGVFQSHPEIKLEVVANIMVKEKSEDIQDGVWTIKDFTYEKTTITGFSESGIEKLKTNKDLVLPKTNPQGENITHIGDRAFSNKGLTSLIIPEGLDGLVIEAGAFRENQLNKVVIPEGVREILTFAFYKNNLKYVDFPGTLQKVGNQGFAHNELISLTFPEGNEKLCLDSLSFYNNELTSITILMEVNKIHEEAFKSNKGHENDSSKVHIFLSKVDLENNGLFENSNYHRIIMLSVESIKEIQTIKVDYGTTKENINLPENIELRLNNRDIKEVNVDWLSNDYDAEKSGEYTFIGSYDLPEGITGEKLEITAKVVVKESLEERSEFEFSDGMITKYMGSKTDIIIPEIINGEEVVAIGNNVFKGKGITSVIIPDTVKTIGMAAFAQNELTEVELPKELTDMGNMAFFQNKLTSVRLNDGLILISTAAFRNNQLTSVEIPESVTSIARQAFMDNSLEIVNIPDRINDIGASAFENNNLSIVTISVDIVTIGSKAFDGNPDIKLEYLILIEAIGEAEKINTTNKPEELVQTLEEAIEKAKELNKEPKATLKEVNEAVQNINSVIKALDLYEMVEDDAA